MNNLCFRCALTSESYLFHVVILLERRNVKNLDLDPLLVEVGNFSRGNTTLLINTINLPGVISLSRASLKTEQLEKC